MQENDTPRDETSSAPADEKTELTEKELASLSGGIRGKEARNPKSPFETELGS